LGATVYKGLQHFECSNLWPAVASACGLGTTCSIQVPCARLAC
jgi:hypothetical protein